jgi:Zn finger protein HypA/HybF involved in hydrogenase expression
LSLVNARSSSYLDVRAALDAISSTGRGRCWHCERKLPPAEEAVDAGWHVQRVQGARVASIILVCPKCRRKRAKVSEEDVLRSFSPPACNVVQ